MIVVLTPKGRGRHVANVYHRCDRRLVAELEGSLAFINDRLSWLGLSLPGQPKTSKQRKAGVR